MMKIKCNGLLGRQFAIGKINIFQKWNQVLFANMQRDIILL